MNVRIRKTMPAIIGFLFGLCMMINVFPPMAYAQKTAADVADVDQIRILDASGQPKNSFHEYEDVKIEIEWSTKSAMKPKDQLTIELPKELQAYSEKAPMKDANGQSIGQCAVSKTTLTCTYDEAVKGKTNLKGSFFLQAQIKGMKEKEIKKKLAFQVNGKTHHVPIHIVGHDVKKEPEKTNSKIQSSSSKTKGVLNEDPNEEAQIQIVKVDQEDQNQILPGAHFDLLQDGKVIDSLVTDANGKAVSKKLPEGTYTLKETKAPTGYQLPTKTMEVKLENKKDMLMVVPNMKELGSLKVVKKDSKTGALLKGAQFQLYDEEGHIASQPQTTDQNGVALFENLVSGQYSLKETKAPEGYNKSNVEISVKIVAGEITQLEVKNEKQNLDPQQPGSSHGTGVGIPVQKPGSSHGTGVGIPVKKPDSSTGATNKSNASSKTVVNKQKANNNSSNKLPQTGDAGSMAPIIGAILILAAIRLKI
ncbi:SpaA isopeptide-forming pilin-related protein [Bacillus sp. FJAT-52991]|uniref:SpaA isopeptide-forming pilin-related protein n=1 Tax=Bacillus kandeliae TaxID=3129297 RepID=A0ABZ2N4U2_9BACI